MADGSKIEWLARPGTKPATIPADLMIREWPR